MVLIIILGMYQNDLQTEYDKILKTVMMSQKLSDTTETVKEPDFILVAKQHDDNLRHPSAIMIELKVK